VIMWLASGTGPVHIEIMTPCAASSRRHCPKPDIAAESVFQNSKWHRAGRRADENADDFLGTVQTMSGAYVGVYFLGPYDGGLLPRAMLALHDWTWLTRPNDSMLVRFFHTSA